MHGQWWKLVVVAALVGCSSGSQSPRDGSASGGTSGRSTGGANGTGTGAGGNTGGGANGVGGAPSPATDTNPANPHVTNMPPVSPNGPTVTVQLATGGATGAGTGGGPAHTGGVTGNGSGGASGTATGGASGKATGGVSGGATGGTGAGNSGGSGTGSLPGAGGTAGGAITDAGAPSSASDAGPNGNIPATWPTVDCVGGPCGPPGVCVNLDFLFVACAHCGGVDEVCCPPYATGDPWLGTCGAGLVCAHNPNFHSNPPLDLVQDVCQVPGSPPPADGGLNHERLVITN